MVSSLMSMVSSLIESLQAQARLIEELAHVLTAHGRFHDETTKALLMVLDEHGMDSMQETLLEKMAEMVQSLNQSRARLEEWSE